MAKLSTIHKDEDVNDITFLPEELLPKTISISKKQSGAQFVFIQ